jgi:hypothetical protein
MPAPLQTLETFYNAFRMLDAGRMEACYARAARFDDPVFSLQGRERIGGLWRMLCEGITDQGRADWRLDFDDLVIGGAGETCVGHAHWEPRYRFGPTGRRVHNVIDATFTFDADGMMLTHRDDFDLWRWARQAMGLRGALFGWSPWFTRQVRATGLRRYERWMARQGKLP